MEIKRVITPESVKAGQEITAQELISAQKINMGDKIMFKYLEDGKQEYGYTVIPEEKAQEVALKFNLHYSEKTHKFYKTKEEMLLAEVPQQSNTHQKKFDKYFQNIPQKEEEYFFNNKKGFENQKKLVEKLKIFLNDISPNSKISENKKIGELYNGFIQKHGNDKTTITEFNKAFDKFADMLVKNLGVAIDKNQVPSEFLKSLTTEDVDDYLKTIDWCIEQQ